MFRHIPALSLLVACDMDYGFDVVNVNYDIADYDNVDLPQNPDPTNPTVDTDSSETVVTTSDCGFEISTTDGDYVQVESDLTYYSLEIPVLEVIHGADNLLFWFAAVASKCGNVEIVGFTFTLESQKDSDWLSEVHENNLAEAIIAEEYPLNWEEAIWGNSTSTHAVQFQWCTPGYGSECNGDLEQNILVQADRTESVQLLLPFANMIPVGEDFYGHLTEVVWRDVTTGHVVTDYPTIMWTYTVVSP